MSKGVLVCGCQPSRSNKKYKWSCHTSPILKRYLDAMLFQWSDWLRGPYRRGMGYSGIMLRLGLLIGALEYKKQWTKDMWSRYVRRDG